MSKFKKGDRVKLLKEASRVKAGATGTVYENDAVNPYIIWDSPEMLKDDSQSPDKMWCAHEDKLELITEPSVPTEIGPAPGTEEWWRWTIATEAMQGILVSGIYASNDNSIYISKPKEIASRCVDAVQWADALIAELKGGAK